MRKKTSSVTVDGYEVPLEIFERESFTISKLTIGTNGFKGGDSGHGSRTYIKLNIDGGNIHCYAKNVGRSNTTFTTLQIVAGGDDELHALIENLEEATKILKKMSDDKKDNIV